MSSRILTSMHSRPPPAATPEIATKHDLISVANSLLDRISLSDLENELLENADPVEPRLLQTIRGLIFAGADPLGDAYSALRAPEERRATGSIYTPVDIVAFMVDRAATDGEPERVVDPGCGSGRFLLAAARRFPEALLIGIDNDPLAVLLLRANAAALGITKRLTVRYGDFRDLDLPRIGGATLFIGNPPFVRHHNIGAHWKNWFAQTAAGLGYKASKLAGLHAHFFLKTRELGRAGDFGAFITSAEWLDVNYGAVIRKMLSDGMGGTVLHIISPESKPFPDALTTAVIAQFKIGRRPMNLTVRRVSSSRELSEPVEEKLVPWVTATDATRWSALGDTQNIKLSGFVELGELCRVHRGQVTGANRVWIAGRFKGALPDRILVAAITSARELIRSAPVLALSSHLKRVIDLPATLDSFQGEEMKWIDRFLEWAEEEGADRSYVARHRTAWWAVGLRPPAPILCTYMARRNPVFVRNAAGARHINIAHGLYPRLPMTDSVLDGLVHWLNANISQSQGRTYSGGLTKFEPRELERLHVPQPHRLTEEYSHRDYSEHAEYTSHLG